MDYLTQVSNYLEQEKTLLQAIDMHQISDVISILENARLNGKRIFVMGNGGSASTASHFCCDLNKCVCPNSPSKFKFICLNDNIPTMLAYANDFSFDEIFVSQLENLYETGDVICGISTSGNSANVVRALQWGKMQSATTIAITGFDGGMCSSNADYVINIPCNNMQMVEDCHLIINHCIVSALNKTYNNELHPSHN